MAVILDTSTVPPADRAEAVRHAMAAAGVPGVAVPLPGEQTHARIEAWPLGSAATLLRRRSTGIRLQRTARQVGEQPTERVALTLLSPGAWRFSQARAEHASPSSGGTLLLVDQTAPYEFHRYDVGTTIAVNVDIDVLDLPMDTVVAAVRRMTPRHPLHPLISQYLRLLAQRAVHDQASLRALNSATPQLARALIADAGGDTARARSAYQDSLLARTQCYVAIHATERTLTAQRIALAHHISVRSLYKLWQADADTLSQAIIAQRLVVARQMLQDPILRSTTIAEVARRSGFADPTHFTHRFTRTFGTTPSAWRAATFADRRKEPATFAARRG